MATNDINRMKELNELLAKAADAYYNTGVEIMSDKQYDEHHRNGTYPFRHTHSQHHTVHGDQCTDRDIYASREHNACHAAGHAYQAGVSDQYVKESLEVGKAL